MAEIKSKWKRRRKQYKVYVRFSSYMPFIVAAYNSTEAKKEALKEAQKCATESEQLEVNRWMLVDRECECEGKPEWPGPRKS